MIRLNSAPLLRCRYLFNNFRSEEVPSETSELAEYRRVQEYCSSRLDSLLDDLQNTICDLCEEQTDHEDKLMVSLAGLKQVRLENPSNTFVQVYRK